MEERKCPKLAALAAARWAWHELNTEQRASFLAWILEEADASGVGHGLVSIEQKIHGVPFRRMTIDGDGYRRFLVHVEDGDETFEQWLTADEVKGVK